MTYTASDFKRDLEQELSKGYDVVRIARMAFSVYHKHVGKTSRGLKQRIFQIVAMEEGPEFVLSEEQLRQFAKDLVPDDSTGGELKGAN